MVPSGRPSQLRARLFYFTFFAAIASLVPFLVVYYERLGLDGRQIGVLSALIPIATLSVGPLWGALADGLSRHRVVAMVALAGTTVSGVLVAIGSDFATLLPLVAALAIFAAPVIPLTDTAVLAGLRSERERYGRLRLWGAIGFGIASLIAGVAVDRFGLAWSFGSFGVLLAATIVVAHGLAWRDVADDRDAERSAAGGQVAGRGLVRDFVNVRWFALLAAGFLGGAAFPTATTFFFLYLTERGAATSLIGIALAVATISEIPVMFLASRWLRWVRPRTLLLAALGMFAVRAALYAAIDSTAGLVAVQLLHGPSFALLLVAGVGRADRLAIPGRRATGQALFTASVMGLGATVGSLAGGGLYDAFGPRRTYLVVAVTLALATALLAAWRVDERTPSERSDTAGAAPTGAAPAASEDAVPGTDRAR